MKKMMRSAMTLIICLLLLTVSFIAEPSPVFKPAHAQSLHTITLKSGNGNVGERDLTTQFTLDGGLNYQDAFIVETFSQYSVIPGTGYLSASPDLTLPAPGAVRYRTLFQLPEGYDGPSLSLQVHADNAATFFLNGVKVAEQPQMELLENFQDPAESFVVDDESLFKSGTNILEIDVLEYGIITALDYMAVVSFESASALTLAIDIKPTSCPNPLKVGERGLLPVAIVRTEEFDVSQVDPNSIKLVGLSPLSFKFEDVTTPFEPFTGKVLARDCNTLGADGLKDVVVHFDHLNVTRALGSVSDGQVLVLKLTGNLKPEHGGAPFEGEDVVIIRKKK